MNRVRFLVFSDTHITPRGFDTSVLQEISQLITKSLPEYIVCTGDIGDFKSQNKLIKNRGLYSVEEEMIAVLNCFEKFLFQPLQSVQTKQRLSKKKMYKPSLIFCMGNHDAPVQELLGEQIQLIFEPLGCNLVIVPYRSYQIVEGVAFSHTFEAGISGKACTSSNQILSQTLSRSISGHSHVREISETRDVRGFKQFAIKMPCATLEKPSWAGQGTDKWDIGYLVLQIDRDSDWFQYTFREVQRHGRRI